MNKEEMPNRILREGIITSEAVNSLSWAAEVFYRRLHSVVDDYGRFSAHPSLLRAACYPLRLNDVSDRDIVKWLDECSAKALVKVYEVEGKRFLEVVKFEQRVRADKSKYPQPPTNGGQMTVIGQSSAPVVGDGDVNEDEVLAPTPSGSPPVALIPLNDNSDFGVSPEFLAELEKAYPRVDGPQTLQEIRVWCLANPAKRKTRRGAATFVNRWFERVQNGR